MLAWLDKTLGPKKKTLIRVVQVVFSLVAGVMMQQVFFNSPAKSPQMAAPLVSMPNPSIQDILKGLDDRDLRPWLAKLTAKDKDGRQRQIRQWYEQRLISSKLWEALLLVVGRLDGDMRANPEEIQRLRRVGQKDLAEILERLNQTPPTSGK
jgi:hypothetical protein